MQRHHTCFYGSCSYQQEEYYAQHHLGSHGIGHKSASYKIKSSAHGINQNDTYQKELAGDQGINQIFTAGELRLVIPLMEYQRPGRYRQHFKEYEEGQKVG